MKLQTTLTVLVASSLTLLIGCATSPTTDEEFGDSVRQMVRSQKIFVAVDETPNAQGDGQRLEAVLEGYREYAPPEADSNGQSVLISTGQ